MNPRTTIIAALAALLTTTAAHAQDSTPDDRQAWQDLQGRWKGRFRLQENDCNWKGGAKRTLAADIKIRPDADLDDPDNGGLLTGRWGKRRFDGMFMGADPEPCDEWSDDSCYQDEFANAVFYSDAPVRMGNGWTCRLTYRLGYYYSGGTTAEVNLTETIRCRGTDICETTYSGTLRKARR